MSKTKAMLPKFEFILIIVFFFSFMIWAVSRCNSTKEKYQQAVEEEITPESPALAAETAPVARDTTPLKPRYESRVERITPLYVTYDGMNVRSAPDVDSKSLGRLKLFDEVIFMGEVTDFKETIEIGSITPTEPWIKIKTQKGKEGWVYGAGLSYYKTKLNTGE
jgi:hypothetical protein